jgi:hypothetical protein
MVCLYAGRRNNCGNSTEEWRELALKDGPHPHIALLSLHLELRVKFNFTTTWECARSMSGTPYHIQLDKHCC